MRIDFNRLIHSATYYLCYQDRIGRDFMIDESSLKYPIADYLTSLEIPMSSIRIEFQHPDLFNRSIDLVTIENTKDKIESAFEFKIARQNTKYKPEQERIFNDLLRLHLIADSCKIPCYFLIAGTQIDFIQYFRSIVTERPTANIRDLPKPQGFYTEWFKFKKDEERVFEVKSVSGNKYEEIYRAFIKTYKSKDKESMLELPEKIKTTCVEISPLSREFPTPYVGGIWKVE